MSTPADIPRSHFTCEPDPENPGWLRWRLLDKTRYNEAVIGKVIVRQEGANACRVRMQPQHHHTNAAGSVHGAVTLGLIDISLFAAMYVITGVPAGSAPTVDLNTQFIDAGDPQKPLDALVEILRETRRLVFLRGLVVQDEALIASFSGTVRKPTGK